MYSTKSLEDTVVFVVRDVQTPTKVLDVSCTSRAGENLIR